MTTPESQQQASKQQFARQQFQLSDSVTAGNLERTYYTPVTEQSMPKTGDKAILVDMVTALERTILTLVKMDADSQHIEWIADFWDEEVQPVDGKVLVDVEWLESMKQMVRPLEEREE